MVFHNDITCVFDNDIYSRFIKADRLTELVSAFNSNKSLLSVIYRDDVVACAMLVSDVAVTVFYSERCTFQNLLELREELREQATA